jgi:hypothetical protein
MSKKTTVVPESDVVVELNGMENARILLAQLFDDNPHIRKEINSVWGVVESMGNQMTMLGKAIGGLNALIIELKQQRDEQVALNAQQWDEGYTAGEKVGAFMQNHEALTAETIRGIIEENISDGHFVYADEDDIRLFCEALMSGEFLMDEGETLSDLVMAVANRMREDVDFSGEGEDES